MNPYTTERSVDPVTIRAARLRRDSLSRHYWTNDRYLGMTQALEVVTSTGKMPRAASRLGFTGDRAAGWDSIRRWATHGDV